MTGFLSRLAASIVRPAPAGRWADDHRLITAALAAGDVDTLAGIARRLYSQHITAARLDGDVQRIYRIGLGALAEVETYRTPSGDRLVTSEWWGRVESRLDVAVRSMDMAEIEDVTDPVMRELLDCLADLGDVDALARLASVTLVELTLYPSALAVLS